MLEQPLKTSERVFVDCGGFLVCLMFDDDDDDDDDGDGDDDGDSDDLFLVVLL